MHHHLPTPLSGQGRSLKHLCAVALAGLALATGFMASSAWAAVPQTLNYQGFLTNKGTGAPLSATVSVTFKLYDALTAGNLLYIESQTVSVTNGVFNAQIGTGLVPYPYTTPFFYTLAFDKPYWLEITVGTDTLTPRQPLASSAYAQSAKVASNIVTPGVANTAVGASALGANTTGSYNTASGQQALALNTTGYNNTVNGAQALYSNTTGYFNTVTGTQALYPNTTGFNNTANGMQALFNNTTGSDNTATGMQAQFYTTTGTMNTATGSSALRANTTGSNNIGIGANGGASLTTGNFNIDIGNTGVAAEGNTTRIGDISQTRAFISGIRAVTTGNNDAQPVVIDSAGQLGSATCAVGQVLQFDGTKWACFNGFNVIPGTGTNNTATGLSALKSNSTGYNNTASGYQALFSNTTGYFNTVSGAQALYWNTTGPYNTANGAQALFFNTTGGNNTASGFQALFSNTNGFANTVSGFEALYSNTIGNKNTGTGIQALFLNTTGSYNTGTGASSLFSNTTGSYNTADGQDTLGWNTTGGNNTASGYSALYSNTTGSYNTANGVGSLYANTTGQLNTAGGEGALRSNTIGSNNIGIGVNSGSSLTTGNDNIDIGNTGIAGESAKIRVGTAGTHTATYISGIRGVATVNNDAQPVVIDSAGQLGSVACTAGQVLAFNGAQWACAAVGNNVVPGSGTNNIAVGGSALNANTTGYNNSAVGVQAMSTNTSGFGNSAFGYQALKGNTLGNYNTMIGLQAGNGIVSGSSNTVIGYHALAVNPTGSGNIVIGANAASKLIGGDNNIYIGYLGPSLAVSESVSGTINIGDPTIHQNGAYISTFVYAQNFFATSDRNEKQDFSDVDVSEVLRKVVAMPTQGWRYKSDPKHSLHIGPMAQDFFTAFGLGTDDKHISLLDQGGVALAAIQGLNAKVEKLEIVNKAQAEKIAEMEHDRTRQSIRITALELQSAELAELQRTVKLLLARDRLNETVALQH